MSSINPHFTLSYVQPEEYQFSHDSVFLARRVFEQIQQAGRTPEKVLDLCAGCGVIGIDFLVHLQNSQMPLPEKIDFLEVQSVYHPYFAQNIAQIQNVKAFEFLTLNYAQVQAQLHLKSQYDLILCNPPYFKKEMGVLSDSDFKNRCRFFLDSDFDSLMGALEYLLKPDGVAYVLLKDLESNGWPLEQEVQKFFSQLRFEKLEKVRTTDLFRIQLV